MSVDDSYCFAYRYMYYDYISCNISLYLWIIPIALCMATLPLPSLDIPSRLSFAYIFLSEKLQPVKSKWAVFMEISLGKSILSTCMKKKQHDWVFFKTCWHTYKYRALYNIKHIKDLNKFLPEYLHLQNNFHK